MAMAQQKKVVLRKVALALAHIQAHLAPCERDFPK